MLNNFFEKFVPVFNKWCVSVRFTDVSEFKMNKEEENLNKLKKKNFNFEKIISISDIPTKIAYTNNLELRKNSFFSDFEDFGPKQKFEKNVFLEDKKEKNIFEIKKTDIIFKNQNNENFSLKSQKSEFEIENIEKECFSSDEYDSVFFCKNEFENFNESKLYSILIRN